MVNKTAASAKYSAGEKVLCHHQNMLYEAKLLNVRTTDNGTTEYYVHYLGWNNRWDEWVQDDRLLEVNDENLKKQQEMAIPKTTGGKTGGGGSQRSRSSQGAGAGAEEPGGTATSKSKTPTTGGKSKTSTGSSGPSTPFDGYSTKGSSSAGAADGPGGGLELESRASTPSVDGGASVASSSTVGQVSHSGSTKRKAGDKAKSGGGSGSVAGAPVVETQRAGSVETQETPTTGEPKRKRGRLNAPATAPAAVMQPPTGGSTAIPSDGTNPALNVESFDQFRGRQEVQIKMPEELKELVVDDWDFITRQNKLCKLPAPKTIEDILDEYAKYKGNQKGATIKQTHAQETVDGIREYFNEMCGVHLLYKFERPQYNEILAKLQQDENSDTASTEDGSGAKRRAHLSSYYGFPHLLRLFVRIGQMLAYTDLDQKNIDMISSWIQDFLKFLTKNRATLFRVEDYVTASPDYQRKAFVN